LFIVVVRFAPGGIAGLIASHWPLCRGGRIFRLVPAYALVAIPLLGILLGGILLVELTRHMMLHAQSDGPMLSIFKIPMSGASPMPWLTAAILSLGGVWGLRSVWPRIDDAWVRASAGQSAEAAP
jgi:branched-chain amino acid transport system permease protein